MPLFILIFTVTVTTEQVQIKCYNCVTPMGVDDAVEYCNASLYCKGMYCTKGPDALSNGIYHGCNDNPPLDKAGASCKSVDNNMGSHSNCYCKNIDFCNEGHVAANVLLLLIIVVLFYALFINTV
uniref:Protein sleepless n=1 Tax=Caenorhabditis japonica TaxID=281687 RepID=A0A8R1HQK6_CAEJA